MKRITITITITHFHMLPARHDYASLLPPHWKETLLPSWFAEDFSGLDVASAVVGDAPATANLFLKSETVSFKSHCASVLISTVVLPCGEALL